MALRAKVTGRHGWRKGKGFSIGEVVKAKISPVDLVARGLRFDRRRRSTHEINVQALAIL
jgi:ribosomal protein L13E